MVKVNVFFFVFWLLFGSIKCSLDEFFEYTRGGDPNTPEKLEKVIDILMRRNMSTVQVDCETSLFESLIPVFASIAQVSEAIQNKLYQEALFDYMNKRCLATIVKIRKGELGVEGRLKIIQMIWLTTHETNFTTKYKVKIVVPDRTVTFMIKVLTLVDSDSCSSRGMILKLSRFCSSNTCQELVYSSILTSLTVQNKKLPLLKIKYDLENTELYEEFLSKCVEIYKSEGSTKIILETLIRNIINCPNTRKAAEFLLQILNTETLINICKFEEVVALLARLLINSDTFTCFYEVFLSDDDENLRQAKTQMLEIKAKHDVILRISSGSDSLTDQSAYSEYLGFFRNYPNVFQDYLRIDSVFVVNSVKKINLEIKKLIEKLDKQTIPAKKLINVVICFIMLNAIPSIEIQELSGFDYDFLLDAYLRPEITALNPNITPKHLYQVLLLPFAKLETTTIQKTFNAMKTIVSSESEKFDDYVITLSLYLKSFDDQIFLDSLKIVYEFYKSRGMDFNCIAGSLLVKLITTSDHFLSLKVFKFCRDEKMLSKSHFEMADNYISKYGIIVDISQYQIS